MAMKHIKEVIKSVRVSVPIAAEEMLLIRQAREKIKQNTGVSLGYKKLFLYLVVKEINS